MATGQLFMLNTPEKYDVSTQDSRSRSLSRGAAEPDQAASGGSVRREAPRRPPSLRGVVRGWARNSSRSDSASSTTWIRR